MFKCLGREHVYILGRLAWVSVSWRSLSRLVLQTWWCFRMFLRHFIFAWVKNHGIKKYINKYIMSYLDLQYDDFFIILNWLNWCPYLCMFECISYGKCQTSTSIMAFFLFSISFYLVIETWNVIYFDFSGKFVDNLILNLRI